MFYERIGCFYVKSEWILKYQDPPLDIAKICSSLAWSYGLKYFAVRNGSECRGDKHFSSMLRELNDGKGCFGGRGGHNVSDVYRLTSKKLFLSKEEGLTDNRKTAKKVLAVRRIF